MCPSWDCCEMKYGTCTTQECSGNGGCGSSGSSLCSVLPSLFSNTPSGHFVSQAASSTGTWPGDPEIPGLQAAGVWGRYSPSPPCYSPSVEQSLFLASSSELMSAQHRGKLFLPHPPIRMILFMLRLSTTVFPIILAVSTWSTRLKFSQRNWVKFMIHWLLKLWAIRFEYKCWDEVIRSNRWQDSQSANLPCQKSIL